MNESEIMESGVFPVVQGNWQKELWRMFSGGGLITECWSRAEQQNNF